MNIKNTQHLLGNMAMKIKILFGIINYKSTAVYQKKTNKKTPK